MTPNAKEMYGDKVTFVEQQYDAAKGADALVLVTEWREYQNPDFERIKQLLKRPLLARRAQHLVELRAAKAGLHVRRHRRARQLSNAGSGDAPRFIQSSLKP